RRYDQPFFQIHEFEKAFQVPVWWKESLGNGERFGKEGEEDPLITAQDGEACEQQRMSVERAVPDAQTWHGDEITKQTKGDKCATLVKPFVHGLGKTTQTAVNVVDWCAEPSSYEKGKNWIANPTM